VIAGAPFARGLFARGLFARGLFALALISAAAHAQTITVGGAVPQPYTLTDSVLATLPHVEVKAADHGQPEATYDGVTLRDVVARAGAPAGMALRGPALATYVLCTAADGYHVVFALAELDSAFADRTVLVAMHKNGQPLGDHDGPFRIVVPGDQRPARWLRQLTMITVRRGDTP
jgi:DMSO/TMAO reductase YedYZ molybdopterin-dependent catalytic subunit